MGSIINFNSTKLKSMSSFSSLFAHYCLTLLMQNILLVLKEQNKYADMFEIENSIKNTHLHCIGYQTFNSYYHQMQST